MNKKLIHEFMIHRNHKSYGNISVIDFEVYNDGKNLSVMYYHVPSKSYEKSAFNMYLYKLWNQERRDEIISEIVGHD